MSHSHQSRGHYHVNVFSNKPDSISYVAGPHDQTGILAHEIAHFWWHRGSALTTEKWLHESFAEYARIMYIRHSQGEEQFQRTITDLAGQARNLPPLLGTDRFSPQGFDLIYVKGPYLLFELETPIGQTKFIEFLRKLNKEKIETTQNLLLILEQVAST